MLIFKEAFSNILNYVNLNPELLSYLRTNINFISDYIYDISYDNPDLSIEEIIGIIRDDYDYFANCIYSNSGIRSTSLRYEACNYLLDNPQKISELLKIIENDNLSPEDTYSSANIEIYSTDFEETLLKFILYRKTELDTYLSDYSLNDIEYIQNYIDIIRKNLKRQPYIKRKKLEQDLDFLVGDYSQRLKNFIASRKNDYLNEFKKDLIQSISGITHSLGVYGFLYRYCENYNEQMTELGLSEMCIPKTSGKDNPDVYTIFSEAYLKNLSLEQLILLNHFYINRISKEFEAVKNALFVIDSLNLYPDIIDGEENIGYNIPEEILYNELLKISLLQIPSKEFFSKSQAKTDAINLMQNHLTENYTDLIKNGFVEESFSPFILQVKKQWNNEYKNKFYPNLPKGVSSPLENDLSFFLELYNPIFCSYIFKDNSSAAIMAHLNHLDSSFNWGYIPEFNNDGENSIETKKKFLLIGVDCDGLNRPVFTHELSKKFKDFFKTYTGSTLIPLYEGIEDFHVPTNIKQKHSKTYYKDNILKNNITLPLTPKQKKFIKMSRKNDSIISPENYKFFRHLDFLRDTKYFPEHLKTPVKDTKTGSQTSQRPYRFVDLETGKFYQKIDDNLVEITLQSQHSKNRKGDYDFNDK